MDVSKNQNQNQNQKLCYPGKVLRKAQYGGSTKDALILCILFQLLFYSYMFAWYKKPVSNGVAQNYIGTRK